MAESCTGKNEWHGLVGLHRQAVYGRLVGYEGVHDTDRLAMRWIGGDTAIEAPSAQLLEMTPVGQRMIQPAAYNPSSTRPSALGTI